MGVLAFHKKEAGMNLTTKQITEGVFLNEEKEYLLRTYSKGMDLTKELKKNSFLPASFLTWALHHIEITEEVKNHIKERLNIVNSKAYYDVHNIENCIRVTESAFCKNSQFIKGSMDVDNSRKIQFSNDISSSHFVEHSYEVSDSEEIIDSGNIKRSYLIKDSYHIQNSCSIYDSQEIEDSVHLIYSNKVKNSLLSIELSNVENKILCSKIIDNDTPMIFNKEVSARIFERVYESMKLVVEETIKQEIRKEKGIIDSIYFQKETPSLSIFFNLLNIESLWLMLKTTLPFYDRDLAYKLSYSSFAL